jgi:hypothetical protein
MSSDSRWFASARLVGVGLLAGLAIAWSFGAGRAPSAHAQGQAAPPAEAGTIAFTAAGPNGAGQHLYVIDTKTQAFAVYRVDPHDPKGAVRLEAARQYRWDLKLAEFNNQEPQVATIEAMVAGSAPARR